MERRNSIQYFNVNILNSGQENMPNQQKAPKKKSMPSQERRISFGYNEQGATWELNIGE